MAVGVLWNADGVGVMEEEEERLLIVNVDVDSVVGLCMHELVAVV